MKTGQLPLLPLLLITAGALGCGTSPLQQSLLPPPVTITFRSSLLGLGHVVQITNTSSHHLYDVSVVGRNLEQVSSASVKATEHLTPGASVEVGWAEFGNWIPLSGETIEVYAENYVTPKVAVIPRS